MTIQQLEAKHYDQFDLLREEALVTYPTAFSSSPQQEVENRRSRFEDTLGHPTNFILGAFDHDHLVGMVGFVQQDGLKTSHLGFIWGMYVKTDFQGKGIGRGLLENALNGAFKNERLRQVYLAVNTENIGAYQLYLSMKFKVYGTDPEALEFEGKMYDEYMMVLIKTDWYS